MNTEKSLPDRLRIKAGVMSMGEKIEWGSDTSLMFEAADMLEELHKTSKLFAHDAAELRIINEKLQAENAELRKERDEFRSRLVKSVIDYNESHKLLSDRIDELQARIDGGIRVWAYTPDYKTATIRAIVPSMSEKQNSTLILD